MTEESKPENSIIPRSSTDLVRVGNSIDITKKLLLEIDRKKKNANYETVKIGKQIWMSINLNLDEFRNGDKIPMAKTPSDWEEAGIMGNPICAFYPMDDIQNNYSNSIILYNWFAVSDQRGLSPHGFHIPTDSEWDDLIGFIDSNARMNLRGSQSVLVGNLLKSQNQWHNNKNGIDEYGFNGSPTGSITAQGKLGDFDEWAFWWTISECSKELAWIRYLHYEDGDIRRTDYGKKIGYAVRCLKDNE